MKYLWAVVVCIVAGNAHAELNNATGSFVVQADVQRSCTIINSQNIPYGLYNPVTVSGAPEVLNESSIALRCTAGTTNVKVALDQGIHAADPSSCVAPHRRLKSNQDNYITYEMFQNPDRTDVWGCGESNEHVVQEFTSSVDPVMMKTYSRIPGGQNIAEGDYVDTVGISVTF